MVRGQEVLSYVIQVRTTLYPVQITTTNTNKQTTKILFFIFLTDEIILIYI